MMDSERLSLLFWLSAHIDSCAEEGSRIARFINQRGMTSKSSCPFGWWIIKGSNLGPSGYEPVALTN